MYRNFMRFLCGLLAAVLVVGVLPAWAVTATAGATGETRVVGTFAELQDALADMEVGEIVINGHIITTGRIDINHAISFSGDGTLDVSSRSFFAITVESGGHLVIDGDIALIGRVHVNNNGTFTLNRGSISNNNLHT